MSNYRDILVCATNTNVGKTYSSCKLIEYLNLQKIDCVGFKPIETGAKESAVDVEMLLKSSKTNPKFKTLKPTDINCYTFSLPAAPFVAKDKKIELKKIKNQLKKLRKISDIVVIESAGGLMTPIKKNFFMIDLANYLDAVVLLITPSKLGCISETLSAIKLLNAQDIEYIWCVNLHENRDEFLKISYKYYEVKFKDILILEDNLEQIAKKVLKIAKKVKCPD